MKLSLKAYRINANLTTKEVAEIIGVTDKTIQKWERDQDAFEKANWGSVIKLAKASRSLNMTPQTLRLFIQQGVFGKAIKGRGSRYIYRVNWREVNEYVSNREQRPSCSSDQAHL